MAGKIKAKIKDRDFRVEIRKLRDISGAFS